jgi:hypothetical protein
MSADPDPFDDFKEQQKSAAPPPSPLPPEMQEELATTQVNVEMAQARVDQQIALINNATFKKKIELEAKLPGLQIKLKKAMMAHRQVNVRVTYFLRREEETTLRKMAGPEQDPIYNAAVNTFGVDVVAEIERKYGPPFQYNAKGVATMSQLFWAMAFTVGKEILYSTPYQDFYEYDPADGLYHSRAKHDVRHQITVFIISFFRTADIPELSKPAGEIKWLDECMAHQRGMLADNTSFLQRERKYIHLANLCVGI